MDEEQGHAIPYGSRRYSMLCYAKMVNKPFTADSCINCIAGHFNNVKRPRDAFKVSASSLCKDMYLEKVDDDHWVITPLGIVAINRTISYRAALKSRLLGPRYMADIRQKLYSVSNYVFGNDDAALDREDKILSDLDAHLRKILKKRNSRKSSSSKS
jgi:hypothetical protein